MKIDNNKLQKTVVLHESIIDDSEYAQDIHTKLLLMGAFTKGGSETYGYVDTLELGTRLMWKNFNYDYAKWHINTQNTKKFIDHWNRINGTKN